MHFRNIYKNDSFAEVVVSSGNTEIHYPCTPLLDENRME